MAIKPLSFHLGTRDACPCQSINAGTEEKYLFSLWQEHTAGDGNVRDAVKEAMGRSGQLGWLKTRVHPNKAMNIHPARINKDTQSCNVLTNPSPSQNASCNLKT